MKKSLLAILLLVLVVVPGCGGYEESAPAAGTESAEASAPAADSEIPMPPDPIDIIIDPTVNTTTGWTLGEQNVKSTPSLDNTNTLSPLVIGRTVYDGDTNFQITFRNGTTANAKAISVQFSGGSFVISKDANNLLHWSIGGTAQTAYTDPSLGDDAWPANMLIPAAMAGATFTYTPPTGADVTVPISTFKKMVIKVNDE